MRINLQALGNLAEDTREGTAPVESKISGQAFRSEVRLDIKKNKATLDGGLKDEVTQWK